MCPWVVGRVWSWTGPRRAPRPTVEQIKRFRAERKAQQAELWERQRRRIIFPYDLLPGADAEAAFEAARTRGRQEGYVPLIITPDTWLLPDLAREQWLAEAQSII